MTVSHTGPPIDELQDIDHVFGNRVLFWDDNRKETYGNTSIIIPETVQTHPVITGHILQVGEGYHNFQTHGFDSPDVHVGDRVLLTKFCGTIVGQKEGRNVRIVQGLDLVAILDEETVVEPRPKRDAYV